MPIKYRGVKIVPVKVTRYEVRTVDNRKLKSFGATATARAWIDGYVTAVDKLVPRQVPAPVVEVEAEPEPQPAEVVKPRRRRKLATEQHLDS
jgi:hypothetical protein